jgi:hypothetical protein
MTRTAEQELEELGGKPLAGSEHEPLAMNKPSAHDDVADFTVKWRGTMVQYRSNRVASEQAENQGL